LVHVLCPSPHRLDMESSLDSSVLFPHRDFVPLVCFLHTEKRVFSVCFSPTGIGQNPHRKCSGIVFLYLRFFSCPCLVCDSLGLLQAGNEPPLVGCRFIGGRSVCQAEKIWPSKFGITAEAALCDFNKT